MAIVIENESQLYPDGFLMICPKYNDGVLEHIYCDGARFHTLHWDSAGSHCSEPNCEINKGGMRGFNPPAEPEGK